MKRILNGIRKLNDKVHNCIMIYQDKLPYYLKGVTICGLISIICFPISAFLASCLIGGIKEAINYKNSSVHNFLAIVLGSLFMLIILML